MAIYREFYDENAHRFYPFVNANQVPTGLILDLCLLTTPNIPDNANSTNTLPSLYISQLTTDGTMLRVYMRAVDEDSVETDFGCIATIDGTTPPIEGVNVGRRTNIVYANNGYVMQGYIITGDLENLLPAMPASIPLDEVQGRLYTSCILPMTQWLTGIQVGNTTLTGVVRLSAGPGITLGVDTATNTVTFACTGARLPIENTSITTDSDIFSTTVNIYGYPITSINGVPVKGYGDTSVITTGTKDGDWTFAVNADEGLSVISEPSEHTIYIKNNLAKPCCTADDIAALTDNIAALNERVITIQSFQTQLETNMNILSTQLTRI